MNEKIKLIRVDNRLVHGQVGMTWTSFININRIVVVNDETMQNGMAKKLMSSIAKAANVHIDFTSLKGFPELLGEYSEHEKIFVIVKTIHDVRVLLEELDGKVKVNIGNIHYERGRIQFNKKMYLTLEDIEDLIVLLKQGNDIFYQDVPGTSIEKIEMYKLLRMKREM
ncbi:PTS sugar transporter subunit IIB [Floccifex sp.]|uniref:PTS sugar transporter subunit IIB n=1 Tax=Floccifex sp. TaxID=2815810 RepID=UPI002A74DB38|nr:PTS sugar transporter subunit IIB [Floccifex sp.]MDD7281201.1 PTS sugar transporter subunit IIB [Erysipelotrichaceae bacterium]MDY2958261.1 PTS sugar transporter subunit IIB [Floccifex sp.]